LNKYLTKNQTTKLICIVGFVLGLPFVTEGGFYLFELVDDYATNACFLIALLECYIFNKYLGEDTIKYLIRIKTGKEIPQYVYDSINKFAPYSLGGLFLLCFFKSVKNIYLIINFIYNLSANPKTFYILDVFYTNDTSNWSSYRDFWILLLL